MFISFDDGHHWQPFKQGLPNTAITDIRVHHNDLALSTFGRGFWILDDLSVLRQLNGTSTEKNHLFKPQEAYRLRYRSRRSGAPQYPRSGAVIDFYLPDTTQAPVVLEISDGQHQHVRSFAGRLKQQTKKDDDGRESADSATPDSIAETAGKFTIHRGHNRFTWNLRYPGKTVKSSNGNIYFGMYRGPLAAPGKYTVTLSAGDWSSSRSLMVKMDPRVKSSGVMKSDLEAQLKLNLKIRNTIGQVKKIAAEMDTLRTEMKEKINDKSADKKRLKHQLEKLNTLRGELVTNEAIAYPPPMLIDQLQYLHGMTSGADQRPGRDAYKRYKELKTRLQEIKKEWQSFKPTYET